MSDVETLSLQVNEKLSPFIQQSLVSCGELTLDVAAEHLKEICLILRDESPFEFNMLIDICGVDYYHYGLGEWETNKSTETGFERGRDTYAIHHPHLKGPRFATVYHLLSLTQNHRIRLKVNLEEQDLRVPSVMDIWPSANWFEREAFDLFGIVFLGHPDLRRILTDYGFKGHPFRKDFPLIGQVEVRYDAKLRQVVYEPVSIQPRILEPKVIRHDNRYKVGE